MVRFLKIIGAISLLLAVYTVFIVSYDFSYSTVTGKDEFFTLLAIALAVVGTFCLIPIKKITITAADLFGAAFVLYSYINFTVQQCTDTSEITLLLLLSILYLSVRIISVLYSGVWRWFVSAVMISGTAEAVIGLRQIYGFIHSNHSLFKATGSFFNPGPYSGYLTIAFIVAIVVLIRLYQSQSSICTWENIKKSPRSFLSADMLLFVLSAITVASTFIVIPATMSRSAWIAVGVTGAAFYFQNSQAAKRLKELYNKHKKLVVIAGTGIILLGSGALWGIYSLKKNSAFGRTVMWEVSAKTVAEHPLFGVGLGNFSGAYAATQAQSTLQGELTEAQIAVAGTPEYAFNEFLQIAVEGGLVGLFLFLFMLYFALRGLYHNIREVFWGVVSILIFALFSYPFSILPILILFVISLALGATHTRPVVQQTAVSKTVFMMLSIAATAFALWNAYSSKERFHALSEWKNVKMLYNMQVYDKVVDDYAELYAELCYNGEFLFEYGHSLNKTGRHHLSNLILRQGIRLNGDPMFWNVMGNNFAAMGQVEDAERCYLKAYQILPNRIYPLYLLTKLYFDNQMTEKANTTAQRVLEMNPKVSSSATKDIKREINELLKTNDITDK